MSPARRLGRYLYRYRPRYALGVACLLAATGLSLGIPWMVKRAVDAMSRDGAAGLWRYVVAILALAAGHGVARMGSRFTMLGAGQWVEHDVRGELYAHLAKLPPAFYHEHRIGDLMSRASNDISAIRQVASFGTVSLAGTPFTLLVLIARHFNHQVEVRSTAVQEQLGVLSAKIQENLAGMPVVRAYTMETREIGEFAALNREYLGRGMRLAGVQS